MEECKIFREGSRKYQICVGQANLPIEKINSYRSKWGMVKLDEVTPVKSVSQFDNKIKVRTTRSIVNANKTSVETKSCKIKNEPVGSALKKIIKDLTKIQTSETCSCANLAKDMDQGIDWCQKNREYIISRLVKNKDMLIDAFKNSKSDFTISIFKQMGLLNIAKSSLTSLCNLFYGYNISEAVLRAGAEFLLDKAINEVKAKTPTSKVGSQVDRPLQLISLNYVKKTSSLQNKLFQEAFEDVNLVEDKFKKSPIFTFGAHLWPVKGLWKTHCDNWNKLSKIINGKTYIVVALDETTDTEKDVRASFDNKVELIFIKNTHSGEVPSFKILLDLIPRGEDDVFLYAHSKGVRKHTNSSKAVQLWTEIMYNTVIFNHESIIKRFEEGYKCFGAFRTFGDQPLGPKFRWHYAGTFFAVRSKYIPKHSSVKDVYGGVEAWPGSVFSTKEAWVEFADNRYVGAQYNISLMFGEEFQSMYKEWIDANR